MIAYEVLVQTIADWKAGTRPTAPARPPVPATSTGQPEMVEEIESGVLDMGEETEEEVGEEEVAGEPEADVEWSEEDDPGDSR